MKDNLTGWSYKKTNWYLDCLIPNILFIYLSDYFFTYSQDKVYRPFIPKVGLSYFRPVIHNHAKGGRLL